ncbi:two-component system chemotaxis sensor kinase CheA [Sphingomonas sp. BE123]|uniref:chemotaxis protein CheA n=1 Tax=Sphingomonas sp. BE123 TaxID=2817842 RepID=UPI0028592CD4|nr:chemotaxis protein CheA [Sphingomonas sp. BE123]MDR6853484.1 two-component system chemotaxis sensor kinase CheA [Sphingomonas sp. BE123]
MSDDMDDIQAIFFEECAEGLAAAEQGLSAMQAGDVSAGTIAAVFRAVHSIKGGAGAFGHVALTAFAHKFENLLDEVRAGRIAPTPATVGVMLSALDILSDHVGASQGTVPLPDDSNSLAAIQAILDADHSAPAPAPEAPAAQPEAAVEAEPDPFGFEPVAVALDFDFDAPADADAAETPAAAPAEAVWRVEFGPSRDAMAAGAEPILVIRELEDNGGRVVAVDADTLPPLRDLDPEQAYLRWTIELPGWTEESRIRDAFDFVAPDSHIVIERVEAAAVETPAADARSERLDDALALIEQVAAATAPTPAAVPAAPAAAAPPATEMRASDNASQTIRVDLVKLDMLLNLVGELVIRNSILSDRLSAKDQERVELPELARLTREIQDNVMSLRAQPIKQAFSRVPRMLRDLMAETGKQVQLQTHGEMTEVDKGVIEKIGDPLTHLIRNAVDHGLESTEDRLRAGKSPQGTIVLSAEQKGARIIVTVSDDGKGIDRARVRAKAVEKGIIPADAVLSDEEIDQLICAPGFSTAATISNISGRGVGMDVVRSNVEALGGRVEIASVPGKGTTFTLVLPLTLAILDGMVVRLAGQRFVLPLATVIEAIRPEPGQVSATTPGSEVIELRGDYLPVRRLTQVFGLHANEDRPVHESLVIIVESESAGRVGLLVDTIDDRREVVIKSLEQNLHPIRGLGGATILGDGSIALILDVEALVASNGPQTRNLLRGLAA